jgi:hypothetical protein
MADDKYRFEKSGIAAAAKLMSTAAKVGVFLV